MAVDRREKTEIIWMTPTNSDFNPNRHNDEMLDLKRAQEDDVSDDDDFVIPKEHLRNAKKRQKILKASASIQKSQSKTTIMDVRNVALWVLSDSQGSIPRWCMIRNQHLISGVTVIITPFIDRHTLFEHAGVSAGISGKLPFFSHCMRGSLIPMTSVATHRYPAVCPVLSAFLSSPSTNKNTPWISNLSDNEDEASGETSILARSPVAQFLMSEETRRAHDMPELLPGNYPPPGYISTKGKVDKIFPEILNDGELPAMLKSKQDQEWIRNDPDYANLIGIDCEMVETVNGKELARVSLVDHLGRVLYDSVVQPDSEITDYLTQYSGITSKLIRASTTSFREAQKRVLSYLNQDSILVGHAIDNDLKCLRLIHDRIIDTSDIFPHPNGFPSKHSLVFLLQRVLRETLDRDGGHDSIDDARATLRIAMKKFARGFDYAPAGISSSRYYPIGSLLDCKTVLLTGEDLTSPERYMLHNIQVNPNTVEDAKLRIHVLRGYQEACEKNQPRVEALSHVDREIRQILQGLDENHLVLSFSGCGDVFAYKRFEKLADQCNDETQRVEVDKMLQRAKDRLLSSFAIISTVGDLPEAIRRID
jgi:DNA polymerase III epsilon subunit-like protein